MVVIYDLAKIINFFPIIPQLVYITWSLDYLTSLSPSLTCQGSYELARVEEGVIPAMSILVAQYVPDQFPQLQTAVPDAEDESGGEDTDDEDSDTSSEQF